MLVHFRSQDEVEITTPAKVNLFLEILGKRPDGYHDLSTVMMGISMVDRLRFKLRPDGELRLEVESPPASSSKTRGDISTTETEDRDEAWDVPSDRSNLVIRSLEKIRDELGSALGMDVYLQKGIPAKAGLGGGSSDAAATLVAASLLWARRWDRDLVSRIAASLGSDINFFLEGLSMPHGAADCQGRGEQVRPVNVAGPLWFVVVQPPKGCSTRAVFERLEPNGKKTPNIGVLDALASGNMSQLGAQLHNRLEMPACLESPWIERLKRELGNESVLGHLMSGSGAARFALCRSKQNAMQVARRLAARLPVLVFSARSWTVPPIEAQFKVMGIRT